MSLEERIENFKTSNTCLCVTKHVPLPTTLYKINNTYLCPTAWDNAQAYESEIYKYRGNVPGSVRKHYSEYIQKLFKV